VEEYVFWLLHVAMAKSFVICSLQQKRAEHETTEAPEVWKVITARAGWR
jgi:hypothetical protein